MRDAGWGLNGFDRCDKNDEEGIGCRDLDGRGPILDQEGSDTNIAGVTNQLEQGSRYWAQIEQPGTNKRQE